MKRIVILFFIITLPGLSGGFAWAQQPQKVHRIGWIALDGFRPPRDFMTGLRERGYIEGQSIIIEYRSAQGSEERLSEIAAELVRLKPEVIVANGNSATDAARKATTTIPIVFKHGDPIWDRVAGSLAQPGKNLTGLSEIAFELAGKRLELLRDTFPKISRVAVLLDADGPVHRRQFADMEKVAQVLGIQLQALPLHDPRLDFDSLFQRAISERANALLTLPNPSLFRHRTRVLDFAAKNRLPAIYPDSAFANAGGLMSYGVDYRDLNRRAAYYVDRILKGAKPSELPVEQPTKFELVINLETAHQLGLTIPAKVLTWADRVIE
ncbi:MAG TPA: ABC transporter substrate-binding protein [Candidatus Binatia bacterium]